MQSGAAVPDLGMPREWVAVEDVADVVVEGLGVAGGGNRGLPGTYSFGSRSNTMPCSDVMHSAGSWILAAGPTGRSL